MFQNKLVIVMHTTARILITGAGGTLATELVKQLGEKSGQILALDSNRFDVTNPQDVSQTISHFRPTIVYHFASKTDVDWCEQHPDQCNKVNIHGTEIVAKEAKKAGAVLVFPSTYYVYMGLKSFPIDDRIDAPDINLVKGVYTLSKLKAEQVIQKLNYSRSFVVRLGSLFGGKKLDKKFVGKILKLAKTKKIIRLVNDRYIQPSYIKDTIVNLLALVDSANFGTFNMVGHGLASFYDYGRAILKFAHIKDIQLVPITSKEFSESAPRADRLQVLNGKLSDLSLDQMRKWQDALKECIQEDMIEYKL